MNGILSIFWDVSGEQGDRESIDVTDVMSQFGDEKSETDKLLMWVDLEKDEFADGRGIGVVNKRLSGVYRLSSLSHHEIQILGTEGDM